jgi:hypothetical protein
MRHSRSALRSQQAGGFATPRKPGAPIHSAREAVRKVTARSSSEASRFRDAQELATALSACASATRET